MKKHNKILTYDCQICKDEKTYTQSSALIKHYIESHLKSKAVGLNKCQLCDQSFHFKHSLESHLMVNHLNRILECQECHKKDFQDIRSLRKHIKNKHGQKVKHQCHICKIDYPTSQALVRHCLDIHLRIGQNRKECKLCLESFKNPWSLSVHLKDKHMNSCDICETLLKSTRNLYHHLRMNSCK